MFVKQLSVFVENKKGSISEILLLLGQNGINISALSVADTTDYGILRLIVNNPQKGYEIIKNANYTAKLTDVIGFAVPDRPNGLGETLKVLHDNNIEIVYIYSFVGHYKDQAVGIVKTTDLEETSNILKNNDVVILSADEIYRN